MVLLTLAHERKEDGVTAPTQLAKVPKPVWNWKDDDCVRDFAVALRNEVSAAAIAARLMRSYTGKLTASAISGAMNRDHVLIRLRRVAPDAESLINVYRARSVNAGSAKKVRRARQTGSHSTSYDAPRPPRVVVTLEGENIEPIKLENGKPADPLTVNDSMCVYPYDRGNSVVYCGRARVHGSYCADHGALIYRPNTTKA